MKKIYKLLLLICLLCAPVTVFGFTYGSEAECVKDAHSANLSSSTGVAVARSCYVDICNSFGNTRSYYNFALQSAGPSGKCSNGNLAPYKSAIVYGTTFRQGTCNQGERAIWTYGDVTYDCNRTSSGATYVKTTAATQPPVTQPPVTQPPVTQPPVTQAPVTQAPSTSSSTTSSTTTSSTSKVTATKTSKETTIQATNDASIKKIVINKQKTITPEPNSTMNLQIPYSLTNVDVDVTTTDKNANVKIEGNKSIGSEGGYIIITVTSSDGTETNTIVFNVTRYTKEQGDCTIAKMIVTGYDLNFSSSTEQYTIDLQNNEKALDIKVTTNQPEANYVIQGNENLKNNSRITIVVNAEDGTECSYQITVKKSSKAWIYFILIIIVVAVLAFGGYKLKDRLTQGTGKYKYE